MGVPAFRFRRRIISRPSAIAGVLALGLIAGGEAFSQTTPSRTPTPIRSRTATKTRTPAPATPTPTPDPRDWSRKAYALTLVGGFDVDGYPIRPSLDVRALKEITDVPDGVRIEFNEARNAVVVWAPNYFHVSLAALGYAAP